MDGNKNKTYKELQDMIDEKMRKDLEELTKARGELKLDDIDQKIIEKYNLKPGQLTPFTKLEIK